MRSSTDVFSAPSKLLNLQTPIKLYVWSFGGFRQVNLLTVDWSTTSSKEARKMSLKPGDGGGGEGGGGSAVGRGT